MMAKRGKVRPPLQGGEQRKQISKRFVNGGNTALEGIEKAFTVAYRLASMSDLVT